MARTPYVKAPITTPMYPGLKISDMDYSWVQWFKQRFFGGQLQYLEGTHGEMVATDPLTVTEGSVFYDTTRTVWYVARGAYWDYYSGIYQCLQAALPTLGLHDAGFLAQVTDYGHLLQWTGAAWTWGPAELGSGFIQGFLSNPTISGWHLCNGATVSRLNSDGTLTNVTLPDYTTAAYAKLGITSSAGPNAASGDSEAVSAGTPAGTVSQATPVTSGAPSASVQVNAGTSFFVATTDHTHDVPVDGAPTFTGTPLGTHDHGPGTIELRNSQLAAWYRQ